jgi:hypothetical protein
MPEELPSTPERKRVPLTPRKSPEDYWDGYKAGLKAARDGIIILEQARHPVARRTRRTAAL